MIFLALSTSSARGSVALLQGEQLIAERHYTGERRHAERIFGELQELLQQAGVTRDQLEAVACDIGPGSFTGTRVGLASAKGIALGLQIPLWPVCALRSMALAAFSEANVETETLSCCLDAKRGEIFLATYARDLRELAAPRQLPQKAFEQWLTEQPATTACCGAVLQAIQPAETSIMRIDHPACASPDATWLGRLAYRDFAQAPQSPSAEPPLQVPPLALVEPIYVRAPDAVPNLPTPPLQLVAQE